MLFKIVYNPTPIFYSRKNNSNTVNFSPFELEGVVV